MLKMKKSILSFLLIITIFINSSVSVSATSGGGYARTDLSGFDTWTLTEKFNYWGYAFEALVASVCGIVAGDGSALKVVLESLWDELLLEDCTYEEWICARLGVQQNENSGEYELVIDDELADLIYSASVQYIEEESPFWVYETGSTSRMLEYYSTSFQKKSFYDDIGNYFKNAEPREYFYFSSFNPLSYTYEDGTTGQCFNFYKFNFDNVSMVGKVGNYGHAKIFLYDSNWENLTYDCTLVTVYDNGDILETDTTLSAIEIYPLGECTYKRDYSVYYRFYYWVYAGAPTVYDTQYTLYSVNSRMFLSYEPVSFRIYNSTDDMKQYSLGQRPYYVTEQFANYDSSIDNSTTITQTEIDNSITYGDVYNYIINNYDNPDGLTEEELIAILEKYLGGLDDDDDNDDGSGSGGGSGSGDDDDDGGGLSALIKGIGKIFDALLSVIGVLLEYIGKALELLTGTMTKIIDLVPSSITALLGAIFSFFPQEWITAIELALVLGVVIGIVGLFRK